MTRQQTQKHLSLLLVALAVGSWSTLAAQQTAAGFQIVVLDGEDGANLLDKKTAVQPVVEVKDKNNLPIAGVAVLFLLPLSGPSATFPDGSRAISVVTDAGGRAIAPSMTPVGEGAFKLEVRATYRGQTLTTSVQQTNFPTAQAAQQAGKRPSSESNQAQNGQQSAQSGNSAGTGAGNAATSAASSGAAAGGSGIGIGTAVVAGGVAAAAGGGYYAYNKYKESSEETKCDSQLNQMVSAVNNQVNVCLGSSTLQQCNSATATALNAIGNACSCFGGGLSQYIDFNSFLAFAREVGANTSSVNNCR